MPNFGDVAILSAVDSTTYTVTINATPFSINSGIGSTPASIAQAEVAAINGGAQPVKAFFVSPNRVYIRATSATARNTFAVNNQGTLQSLIFGFESVLSDRTDSVRLVAQLIPAGGSHVGFVQKSVKNPTSRERGQAGIFSVQ